MDKKKNSFANIATQAPNLLSNKETVAEESKKKVGEVKAPVKKGRRSKPVAEKERNRVGLSFTDTELENLKELAGLVPLGTFLKAELRKNKVIK